jgi:hypothetical protein
MTTPLITRLEEAAYLQEALAFQAQIADAEGKITTASVCREAAAYIAMLAASPQGEGDCVCVQRGDGPEGCGLCNETGSVTEGVKP